jgi:hypothetical protein
MEEGRGLVKHRKWREEVGAVLVVVEGRRHDRVGGAAPPRPPSGGEDRGYMVVSCAASSFTFGWVASAACTGA